MATLRHLICVLMMCMLYPVAVLSQEQDNNKKDERLTTLYTIPKNVLCGPTIEVLKGLEMVGETEVSFLGHHDGVEPPDKIVVFLHRNPETGSYSVLETGIQGFSCIVSYGNINPPQPPQEQEEKPDDSEEEDKKIKTKFPKEGGVVI